jgi:hypothetical protein
MTAASSGARARAPSSRRAPAGYDSVGTFGTSIVDNVANLPENFTANRNPLTGAFDGCVFGADPGTGICFDQALQSLSSATSRSRGANVSLSGSSGPWDFGAGAGYSRRRYFDFVSGRIETIDPITDQSVSLNAGVGRRLSRFSGMSLDAVASWYDSGRAGTNPMFSSGLTGSYYRSIFMERLQFHAALGIYYVDGLIASTVATGLVGLRYNF